MGLEEWSSPRRSSRKQADAGNRIRLTACCGAFLERHRPRYRSSLRPLTHCPQARYVVGVQSRRFLFALLGIVLAVAANAEAARRAHHRPRHIDSITLTPDGRGSLISITFAGKEHPRLLRSTDPIAAFALADVDNDGDLDIVATTDRTGLVVWRNTGRGRFVFALPSGIRPPGRPPLGMRHLPRIGDGPVVFDDRYDAAMPRAPGEHGPQPAAVLQSSAPPFARSTPTVRQSGRAPPSLFA
jgi:FG-GAP-like repeat